MKTPQIVSAQEWDAALQEMLVKEKEFTRARDALAAQRRRMPWTPVDKDYVFDGPEGKASLLARDGQVIDGALRKHDMSEAAFHRVLREQGLRDVGDVAEVRLEANGKISVLKMPKR